MIVNTAYWLHFLRDFGLLQILIAGRGVEKLRVLTHMAVGAKGHEVLGRVVPALAPLDLVVDLEVLDRSTFLTTPFVPLQFALPSLAACKLVSQPDALHFFSIFLPLPYPFPRYWQSPPRKPLHWESPIDCFATKAQRMRSRYLMPLFLT